MSDTERADRLENRNIVQLEVAISGLQRRLEDQLEDLSDIVLDHSATLDQLNGAMAADQTHGRGANVPLSPFHGNRNEDFMQYIKQFELICSANNYADDKKSQILASYLRDKAFYVYDSLTAAQKDDYEELKAALSAKFQTTDYRRYAHQKFLERKQFPTENVCDYGCDVHRLGLAALEKIESDQRDALIREKFIAGLIPQLRELIIYSNPKSFHEALTLAERLEGLQANKPDHSAKNVLLLESISDRLANLEVQSKKGSPAEPREIGYVVETPRERFGNNVVPHRRFNLGNFRQDFLPAGMVCYRCNRTGHMARNCGQNREINSIVCRLCNRMGHYALNCQRRGPSLGRRPGPTAYRPTTGGNSSVFPVRPSLSNHTMALTVPQDNAEAGQEEQTEVMRFRPLVPALWQSGGSTGPETVEVHQAHVADSETISNIVAPAADQPPVELETSPTISSCELNWIRMQVQTQQIRSKDLVSNQEKLRQTAIALILWATFFELCVTIFGAFGAGNSYSLHKIARPMLRESSQSMWRRQLSFRCPEVNDYAGTEVIQSRPQKFKRNDLRYKNNTRKIVQIKRQVSNVTYLCGDENARKAGKLFKQVSPKSCATMTRCKSSKDQHIIAIGGIYQTNNVLYWHCHLKSLSDGSAIKWLRQNFRPIIDAKEIIFYLILTPIWHGIGTCARHCVRSTTFDIEVSLQIQISSIVSNTQMHVKPASSNSFQSQQDESQRVFNRHCVIGLNCGNAMRRIFCDHCWKWYRFKSIGLLQVYWRCSSYSNVKNRWYCGSASSTVTVTALEEEKRKEDSNSTV